MRVVSILRQLAHSLAVLASAAGVNSAGAADCVTTITRTAPPGISGTVIRSVAVHTDAPINLPFAGDWLGSLRRTTETAVVRRQLLFAPGQRADSGAIAETLRRLRDQRVYADVTLGVVQCTSADTVDLIVTTRDAWTLRPIARIVPPSTVSIGAEDRNLLGTGRQLSVSNDQTSRGHGGSFGFVDPFLFGSNLVGAARFADVAGSHLLRASLRHHELSMFDEWRGEIALGRQTFNDVRSPEHPVASLSLVADIGHRVGGSLSSVTVPFVGVQIDSSGVMAMRGADTAASLHSRRFIGVDLGIWHRAAQFDTVSWFVPNRGFLDTPVGLEEDVLISPGVDRGQRATAARYDAWLGRMWLPARGHLVTADAWTSGYVGRLRENHVDRFALSDYNESRGGFWGGRLMFEQLLDLDPDLRMATLATIAADPSFSATPQPFRAANRAAFASLERAFHVVPIGRASMLDVGVFGAGSIRWDAPNTTTQSFGVAVAGIRFRVVSTNGLVNAMRLDVSYPVHANSPVAKRPLLAVSLGPLFDVARQRDGRRRQQ